MITKKNGERNGNGQRLPSQKFYAYAAKILFFPLPPLRLHRVEAAVKFTPPGKPNIGRN